MKTLGLLAVLISLAGCPQDPLIGDWQSRDLVAGKHNTLAVDEDMRGDSKIYFYIGSTPYYAEFNVDMISNQQNRYRLAFDCDGDCASLDFDMDCTVFTDTMSCSGTDKFSTYDFHWVREGGR